ncbi:GGDEF domain-containing protein [Actinokineospora iranica]|uniref:Diguanylate cyclase (GGDEF) domain-containing protein n=1 Tax=Actinokineospora iranica TaxID=1271860 RepID=A0A1G6X7V0_9PSEU|nr:GGDEF domain-containing protein [Actinokineospora iranica]SDD73376.1 diguanylate cyclase (GGDEF) domain-containing protein [Actinokineospora iranica]
MIAFEAITVVAVVLTAFTDPPAAAMDWRRLAVLVGAGAVHLWLSRRTEETRRDSGPGPHMDTSVVWILPAMVLLPAWMAVASMLLLRVQLYLVARRPLYRYTFGTAGILLAALASLWIIRVSGVDVTAAFGAREALVLALAGMTYFLVNAIAIGGVIALSTPQPTWTAVAGTRRDNAMAALTVCLGALAAIAIAHAWLAPLFLVPLLCALDWGALQIENLRGDARTDHKTQLLNSRGWHEQAGREIARARRQHSMLAVAVLDLDYFKQVNDTWGHPAGDAVLRAVGAVLRETTRKGDVVGRFGGEEFVLLLPDTDAAQATVVAERVRMGVAAMNVAATDKRGQPVLITGRTTSIGVAAGPGSTAELETLLRWADAAVYEAKSGGRDQVRLAEPPTSDHPAP